MTDGLGTTAWTYDNADRLTSESGPFANSGVAYSYDNLDRVTGISVNGTDATTFAYDGLSRLHSITDGGGTFSGAGSWTLAYDSTKVGNLSLPTLLQAPNGTQTAYTYDTLERLTGVQHQTNTASVLSSFTYAFDNTTHKDAVQSLARQVRDSTGTLGALQTVSFGYDSTDQLTGELSNETTPLVHLAHAYDAMGNRTTETDTANNTGFALTFNNLNQLTQSTQSTLSPPSTGATTNYGYDLKGNLTSSLQVGQTSGPTYTYDDEDRLTSVTIPGSTQTTFAYDGLSRLRESKTYSWISGAWVLQNETRRIYDGMDIIQERNSSNAVTANLTRAGNIGGILARTTSGGSVFHHSDGDGNVVQLTNSTGAVVGSYTYNAFGTYSSTGTAATANPYTFSSKEQFGGLYNFGYRYYMAGSGRCLNRDPIREAGGLNLYGYVGNDPEDGVDKYGFQVKWLVDGVAAIYNELTGNAGTGMEAHHINQVAAFKNVKGYDAGESVTTPMRGDAMFGVGSPHYEFHRELDERFDQYRVGGCKHGQVPTNGEYGEKVEELLVEYGKSSEDAKKLSDLAREERTRWGLDEDAPMNDLPGRFNQRGQRTTAPTENDENEEKSDDGENDGLTLPELQADNVLITGIDQGLNRVNGEPVDGGDDIGDE